MIFQSKQEIFVHDLLLRQYSRSSDGLKNLLLGMMRTLPAECPCTEMMNLFKNWKN